MRNYASCGLSYFNVSLINKQKFGKIFSVDERSQIIFGSRQEIIQVAYTGILSQLAVS